MRFDATARPSVCPEKPSMPVWRVGTVWEPVGTLSGYHAPSDLLLCGSESPCVGSVATIPNSSAYAYLRAPFHSYALGLGGRSHGYHEKGVIQVKTAGQRVRGNPWEVPTGSHAVTTHRQPGTVPGPVESAPALGGCSGAEMSVQGATVRSMDDVSGETEVPVLLGFLAGEPIAKVHEIRVWCGHCCSWHIHGVEPWARPGTKALRLAHCFAPGSPYKESGYCIEVAYARYEDVRRQVRSATTGQQLLLAEGRTTPSLERMRRQAAPMDSRGRKPAAAATL